jgi:hypothetical protein
MPVFGRCPEAHGLGAGWHGDTARTSRPLRRAPRSARAMRRVIGPLRPRQRKPETQRPDDGSVLPQKPLAFPAMARCTWFDRRPRWGAKQRSPVSAPGFCVPAPREGFYTSITPASAGINWNSARQNGEWTPFLNLPGAGKVPQADGRSANCAPGDNGRVRVGVLRTRR